MEAVLSIFYGGLGGAVLFWLLRNWVAERLKQSIQHEYAEKLETHKAQLKSEYEKQLELYKAELNSRMESVRHERELDRLKTSLFFDHQREAFASLLIAIAETRRKWFESAYDPELGLSGPVPHEQYQSLQELYYNQQLFLDTDCLAAIELVLEVLRSSFPWIDGEGEEHSRDFRGAYEQLEYLQPRIAAVFQQKIGVATNSQAEEDIALLGAVLLLNHYHFQDVGLPIKGALEIDYQDEAADIVAKGKHSREEVISKLKQFEAYLRREGHGTFHEAATTISRYLGILTIIE